MRKFLFNLHLYVALIAGVLILILGLTGSIMAFEQEIDHVLHWKLTYVTPQPRALSLVGIAGVVSRAYPDEPIRGYGLSTSPNMSYQVATRKRLVYINQYTGEILGTQSGGDAVSTFLGTVHQLHLRLLIRNKADTGGLIESCAGLAVIFLALTGLYLWWPLKRLTLRWNGPTRRSWFDLHNSTGIFSLVFLLILATTGVVIGFDEITTPLFFKVTGSTPAPRPPRNSDPHALNAQAITPDQAVELARTALPGAAPFAIDVPGPNGTWFIRARFPEDLTPGGRSQVVIDQYTGKVLFALGSRTAPGGARMVIANRAIHTGDILGIPSKIVMSLASLMVVVQFVSGVVMWWKRRG
jgi:uncharacterized iron-regulated membrane protein